MASSNSLPTSNRGAVTKNTHSLMAAELISRAMGMLLFIVAARSLGASDIGLFSFALSLNIILSLITRFGFENLIVRDIAKDASKSQYYFTHIFIIKIALSLFAFLATLLIFKIFRISGYRAAILWIAVFTMIFESYLYFFASLFRAHQVMSKEALLRISLALLAFLFGTVALLFKKSLSWFMFSRLLSYSLSFCLGIYFLKGIGISLAFDGIALDRCKLIFKQSVPFVLSAVAIVIYAQTDIIMLSMLKGDSSAGWYSAALKFPEALVCIPLSLSGALFPAMAKAHTISKEAISQMYQIGIKYLLVIMLAIIILMCIASDNIIYFFFGASFSKAIPAFRILAWVQLLSSLNTLNASTMAAIHAEWKYTYFVGFGALLNILTNFILIPRFGHIGASLTTLFSEGVVLALQYLYISKAFGKRRVSLTALKSTVATGLALAAGFFLKAVNLVFALTSAMTMYALCVFMLRILNKQELYAYAEAMKLSPLLRKR